MGYLAVIVAALGCFAMGAVWYMSLSRPWMRAAQIDVGEDGRPANSGSAVPFIISGITALFVAGMMRHILVMGGIDGVGKSALAGLGVGLFFIAPWTAMNYAYAARPRELTLIDGGYAILGPTITGLILGLF